MLDAIKRGLEVLGVLPTTQFRVLISAIPILATTARYVSSHSGWQPSWEWLLFLLALVGVDTAHFIGKRRTDVDYVKAQKGRPDGEVRTE